MLESLYTIWWSSLTGNGNTVDIPMLLRTMASGVEPERGSAFVELRNLIWNKSSVYEATSHVVPFMYEVLEAADNVEFTLNMLSLIALLAAQDSDTAWAKDTREAVAEGIPVLVALLRHKAASVRSWSAYTLSCIGKDAVPINGIAARLDLEGHPSVLSTVLLVLSDLDAPQAVDAAKSFVDSDVFTLKFAAVVALARSQRSDAPEECVDFLTSIFMDADVIESEFGELELFPHQAIRNMIELAVEAFECLGHDRVAKSLPKLLAVLKNMPEAFVKEPLDALLFAAFGRGADARAELNETERDVLKQLMSYENLWTDAQQSARTQQFARHGLPGELQKLSDFVNAVKAH